MTPVIFNKETGYAEVFGGDLENIRCDSEGNQLSELVEYDGDPYALDPGKTLQLVDGEVKVVDAPPVKPPVPREVPMSRLCIALVEFDLYDTIRTAVDNMPEKTAKQRKQKLITSQWFERAQVARRDNVLLNAMATSLNILQETVDDVFRFADAIPD